MEAAVVSALLGTLAPKIFTFLEGNHDLWQNLEHDIEYIRQEFRMIDATIQDHDRCSWTDGTSDVQMAWIRFVRELACSIEDCIDRFMHRVARDPGPSSLRRVARGLKTIPARLKTIPARIKFAGEIRKLRKMSEDASKLRASYASSGGTQSGTTSDGSAASTSSASETPHTLATGLVGVESSRDELLELIRETDGQPKQLKVITIVGFGGLGKTLLATQAYNTAAAGGAAQYEPPPVWVDAAERGHCDVLKDILQKLGVQVHDGNLGLKKLSTRLRECLEQKRFFIVIDDIRTEYWNTIKNAFPASMGLSSRVIVTTALQSIANACSSAHGHVYVMRTLDEDDSRELFFKEASLEDRPSDKDLGSEARKKCDGLPLALITTAQFLQSKGNPTRTEWAKLCDNLGEHLDTEDTLARMKHVLVRSYSGLSNQVIRACLLYLCVFPSGHPVRTRRLLRRWIAEGFIQEDYQRTDREVAVANFKELVDRSIIQPIDVSNNTEVKTCQTHGMILEFIKQKSMRADFITLLHDQVRLPSKIRRLSLQNKSATRKSIMNPNMDLSLVRSLTIFGKSHESLLKFSNYELLRVLDLEECDDLLENEHLREICNLVLLRYLSLGGAITELPKEIAKLKFLETLDVRRTKIKVLPIRVIKLPCLIHLFGVFQLLEHVGRKMNKVQTFLSKKSKLETLSGFFADKSQEFAQLMDHMKHLTKVKIWCESSADDGNLTHLSKAIQGFIQRGTNLNDARSLSLNFKEWPEDLLTFPLEISCYLSSLKLQGNICSLPPFVTTLGSLTELCISSPNQLSGDILAALSRVCSLHYLKLIGSHLDKFIIEHEALESLRRLCIVVHSMADLEIQEGALLHLESLQLLCEDLNGFCGVRIESLGRLKEVALHDGASDTTKQEWRDAAKNHPKRPKVLFIKAEGVDQMRMGSEPAENSESPALPADPVQADVVQTQLNEESEPSVAGMFANLIIQPSSPVQLGMGRERDAISARQ